MSYPLAPQKISQAWQPDCSESILRGFVGIEMAVSEIQLKFKVSQNRSRTDQEQSIKALESMENHELAKVMRKENQVE